MSAVVVLTPVVVAAWPAVAASVAAAVTAAGFRAAAAPGRGVGRTVTLPLDDVEVPGVAEESLCVERNGVRVVFATDRDGRLTAIVTGTLPDAQLEAIGRDLSRRVIQDYVRRRLDQSLGAEGFVTVEESQGADSSIRLRLRRYEA